MSDLEFTGGLDFSEAAQSLDEFVSEAQSRLADALSLDTFAANLSAAAADAFAEPIPITADASAIPGEVDAALADASVNIPVEADTAPATSAVTDLVGSVDSESASITVDADTTEASAALDDLAASATTAGSSLSGASGGAHEFGLSTGQLAGVAGLAVGEVGSLREASSLLGERTAAATAGVLGLGVGVGELYRQGLNAVSAEERFNAALGDQAQAVQRVQVGTLDADLFHLGTTFGSADAAMRNATASVFQFAINSGASAPQARDFADGIAAISARAVATKPSVGDIADVMDRAAIGIGRARTAASLLNVGLSTTEVNTRAAAIAQENGEASASAYDKSLAALQITVERFGPSLKANVEEGSKNAANEAKAAKAEFDNALESFGKPLVTPGLDLIKAAIPVAEDFGRALADVASVAIPLLTTTLDLIGPAIEPALAGFLAFKAAEVGLSFATFLSTAPAAIAGFLGIGTAAETAGAEVLAGGEEMAAGEAAATGGLSLIIGAAAAGIVALGGFGDAEGSVADQTHKMTDEFAKLDGAQLAKRFDQGSAARAFGDDVSTATARLREFRSISEDNVGTGQRLLEQLQAEGANTDGFQKILDNAVAAQKRKNAAEQDSTDISKQLLANTDAQNEANATAYTSLQNYASGTGTATQALTDLNAAQKEANDEVSLYTQNLLALQGVQGDVTAATIAFKNSQEQGFEALAKNGVQFDINTQAGRDNVSALQDQVSKADALAEATYKSELATRGDTQARADANQVLTDFRAHLDTTLTGLGLNITQVQALETSLGLLQAPPPIALDFTTNAPDVVAEINKALSQVPGGPIPGYATFNPFGGGGGSTTGSAALDAYLASLPKRAGGGDAMANTPYLVNENTPNSEIFVPKMSGTIYTQSQWAGAGGGGGGIHVGQVILQQASPNPVRETISAGIQLRDGASMVKLG